MRERESIRRHLELRALWEYRDDMAELVMVHKCEAHRELLVVLDKLGITPDQFVLAVLHDNPAEIGL